MTKRPPSAGDSVQFQTQWWIERFGFYLPAVLTVLGSRGDIANGLRLDLVLDDQLINCVEVVSATPTKALLMQRIGDSQARDHAINRGIGVVSTLAEAVSIIERLHDVLPQKRGRMLRLSEWFSGPRRCRRCPRIHERSGRFRRSRIPGVDGQWSVRTWRLAVSGSRTVYRSP